MKRLLLVFIFLLSVFSLSSAQFTPMNDGAYTFNTIGDRVFNFVVEDNLLEIIVDDTTGIDLILVVDKQGNFFYYNSIYYIKVGFINYCLAMIESPIDRFFLYNTHPICK